MIRTGEDRLSWFVLVLVAIPAGVAAFVELCSLNALTFTMRKFVADPAVITLLGSSNLAFNFLIAPWAAWKSDRIWTPCGRRIPFIVVGWSILAAALIAVPLASSFGLLAIVIVAYQFGMDFGYTGPWDPLYFEIVPAGQRGRALATQRLVKMFSRAFFFLILLGKFDAPCGVKLERSLFGAKGISLSGEMLVYFTAAALVLLCVAGLLLFVRETPPEEDRGDAARQGLCPKPQIGGHPRASLDAHTRLPWVEVAMLSFCLVAATSDLGQLQPLLITEQFGYSKKIMGQMLTWVMLPEMLIVLPLLMVVVDRTDRRKLLCAGLTVCTLQPLLFWLFVRYAAIGGIPSPTQFVAFTFLGHVGRMTAALCVEALLFGRIARNSFGKLNMGVLLIRGSLAVLAANGIGLWIRWFPVAGGEGHDYLSGYLYTALLSAAATAAACAMAMAARTDARRRQTPERSYATVP